MTPLEWYVNPNDMCPICGKHRENSVGHGYSKVYFCDGPIMVRATEFIYGRMKRAEPT